MFVQLFLLSSLLSPLLHVLPAMQAVAGAAAGAEKRDREGVRR